MATSKYVTKHRKRVKRKSKYAYELEVDYNKESDDAYSSSSHAYLDGGYDSEPNMHKKRKRKKSKKPRKKRKTKKRSEDSVASRTRSKSKNKTKTKRKSKASKHRRRKHSTSSDDDIYSRSRSSSSSDDDDIEILPVKKAIKKKLHQRKNQIENRLTSLHPKYGLKYDKSMLQIDDVTPDVDFDATTYYPLKRPGSNKVLENLRGKMFRQKTGNDYAPNYDRQDKSFEHREKELIVKTLEDIVESPEKYKVCLRYGWNSTFPSKIADALWDQRTKNPNKWTGTPYRNTQSITLKLKAWEEPKAKESADREFAGRFMALKNKIDQHLKAIASDATQELNQYTEDLLRTKLKKAEKQIAGLKESHESSIASSSQFGPAMNALTQLTHTITGNMNANYKIKKELDSGQHLTSYETPTAYTNPKANDLSCLCGDTLVFSEIKNVYTDTSIKCDNCGGECGKFAFHCPAHSKVHPGGWDLCCACGSSQLNTDHEPKRHLMKIESTNNKETISHINKEPQASPSPSIGSPASPSIGSISSLSASCNINAQYTQKDEDSLLKLNDTFAEQTTPDIKGNEKKEILKFITQFDVSGKQVCFDEDNQYFKNGLVVIEQVLFSPKGEHLVMKWNILQEMVLTDTEKLRKLVQSASIANSI